MTPSTTVVTFEGIPVCLLISNEWTSYKARYKSLYEPDSTTYTKTTAPKLSLSQWLYMASQLASLDDL